MINNIALVLLVQCSDSGFFFLFAIIFHYINKLLQDIGHSSMCYEVNLTYLFYAYWFIFANAIFLILSLPLLTMIFIYICESVSLLYTYSFGLFFKFHMSVISYIRTVSLFLFGSSWFFFPWLYTHNLFINSVPFCIIKNTLQ